MTFGYAAGPALWTDPVHPASPGSYGATTYTGAWGAQPYPAGWYAYPGGIPYPAYGRYFRRGRRFFGYGRRCPGFGRGRGMGRGWW